MVIKQRSNSFFYFILFHFKQKDLTICDTKTTFATDQLKLKYDIYVCLSTHVQFLFKGLLTALVQVNNFSKR